MANKSELKSAAVLIVESFTKPLLQLPIQNKADSIGKSVLVCVVESINVLAKYSHIVSTYLGLLERSGWRLLDQNSVMSGKSVVLVATQLNRDTFEMEVKGVAEVSLELTNGRLPKDNYDGFPFPSVVPADKLRLERYQPYLSNLCVSSELRGVGVGRLLCSEVEKIAKEKWAKQVMYLHAERSNASAMAMYRKFGYRPVTDIVFSEEETTRLGMQHIVYLVRDL